MRRLDTFTIVIIAICLLAAAALIYIGWTKLAGNKAEDDKSALYDEIENDKDGDYYFLDEDKNGTADTNNADANYDADGSSDNTDDGSTSSYDNNNYDNNSDYDVVDKEDNPLTANEDGEYTPKGYSDNGGAYMVLAGSFRQMVNAENHVRNLKNKGYSNASVERFDGGAYAVVLVDRFSSLSEAKSLVSKLEGDNIDAYVKKK